MRVFGIDFTSAPSRRKPITCTSCRVADAQLVVEDLQRWHGFEDFEAFLDGPGDWVAAIDAPLGQPRRLVEALNWPVDWTGYVERVGLMTKLEFADVITGYCDSQPAGDKHHLRETDRLARSCSPMMLYGVPVAKMFYEVAPRVLNANVSVLPCKPNTSGRVVVEAYPALMARRAVGSTSYKNDNKEKGAKLISCRREIVEFYEAEDNVTGIRVDMSDELRESVVAESSADALDCRSKADGIQAKPEFRHTQIRVKVGLSISI